MSKVTIVINTDNAAFEEDTSGELGRIFRELADEFANGDLRDNGRIYDINGNSVGTYDVVED